MKKKVACYFKADGVPAKELKELQKELQDKVMEKISMFPSFQFKNVVTGYDGQDFVNNKFTVVINFTQSNLN